jgi:putative glycosyltransferase (TIGR04348 family)
LSLSTPPRYHGRLRILIVTPAGSGTRVGNRITALRISGLLRSLGHEVKLRGAYEDLQADAMIALHAGKSARAVQLAAQASLPCALMLTGTDIYRDDKAPDASIERSLALAQRLIILQPKAIEQVPEKYRWKTRQILQSARARAYPTPPHSDRFEVCVLAHLRPIKDPLLAARAARLLPDSSKIRVRLLGSALDEPSRVEAENEARDNPRFEWLGPQSYGTSQAILAASQLLVLSSLAEGGPAVLTEAFAYGVPILATRIPAAEGLLGANHPGLYPVRETQALASLLQRCEEEDGFLELLRQHSLACQPSARPEREREDLRHLLVELCGEAPPTPS